MGSTRRILFRGAEVADTAFIPGYMGTHHIKNEPMLFSASMEFAKQNGGPLTAEVLEQLGSLVAPIGLHLVIDTRVHMLMPGQFPAIPGWHCDGVPRMEGGDQPSFDKVDDQIRHLVVTVSDQPGGVSWPQFLKEDMGVEIDEKAVWSSLNRQLEFQGLDRWQPRDGELVEFKQLAPHRACSAMLSGWRYFFRLSFMYNPPRNEVRRQTQVYTTEGLGW